MFQSAPEQRLRRLGIATHRDYVSVLGVVGGRERERERCFVLAQQTVRLYDRLHLKRGRKDYTISKIKTIMSPQKRRQDDKIG